MFVTLNQAKIFHHFCKKFSINNFRLTLKTPLCIWNFTVTSKYVLISYSLISCSPFFFLLLFYLHKFLQNYHNYQKIFKARDKTHNFLKLIIFISPKLFHYSINNTSNFNWNLWLYHITTKCHSSRPSSKKPLSL